jgi:purine-cytosine permease-like protein
MNEFWQKSLEKIKRRRWLRITLGFCLVIGGILGPFLPVLGIWMLPLGLILLSIDFLWAKRWHDGYHAWWERRKQKIKSRDKNDRIQ